MRRWLTMVWLLVFLCLLAAVDPVAADVPLVRCRADPPVVRTFDLVERWRIDADDEGAPLIGIISHVRADEPGGDVLLLDSQLSHILIYSPDGEFRGAVGRDGDGPGEFRRPFRLFVLPDGILGVVSGWPAKIVCLDREGVAAGAWSPRTPMNLFHVRRVPGGWIASGQYTLDDRTESSRLYFNRVLSRFDETGERTYDYLTSESVHVHQPYTHDERQAFFPHTAWDLAADDLLVMSAARDAYRLEYYTLDGVLVRVVEREFMPYRRTAEDKQQIRDGQRVVVNGVRQEIVFHLLDTEPAITSLHSRPDGSLMVFTCFATRGLPDGVVMRYDVHDPDGELRAEVHLRADCDLTYDALRLLPDNRAVILRNHNSTSRAAFGMTEQDDPVREDDAFQVIVCDLVAAD
jgi:hypothetical protein